MDDKVKAMLERLTPEQLDRIARVAPRGTDPAPGAFGSLEFTAAPKAEHLMDGRRNERLIAAMLAAGMIAAGGKECSAADAVKMMQEVEEELRNQ